MNILSLFDGMSCGQLALNRCDIPIDNYFASEIDKYAIKVTQNNFPNTVQLGDVTKIKGENLPKIDLLIGGSPCQGFSNAGNQLNFEDPRSKLFFEYVRILKEVNPEYFLLENVKMKKEYQDVITSYLDIEPIQINSSLFVPQNRPRLYWTNIPFDIPDNQRTIVLKDILLNDDFPGLTKFNLTENAIAYMSRLRKNKERWYYHMNDVDGIASCLTACMYKGVPYGVIRSKMRRLHPIECERLQGVPDNYSSVVSDAQRYKMLGNGWTVDVIAYIFSFLKNN